VRTTCCPSRLRRLGLLLAALALTVGLSACGHRLAHPTSADTEGQYVDAGPLTYQVQLSRELNPYSIEDSTYLKGVLAPPLKSDEMWFGVFMWAKNETKNAHITTDQFSIIDTAGNRYHPVAINSSLNPYAWEPTVLRPLATYPTPDGLAFFGPTQGALVLFRLPTTGTTSVFANRPLTLLIHAPGQVGPSTISLDL
jgi:hypothetical protein